MRLSHQEKKAHKMEDFSKERSIEHKCDFCDKAFPELNRLTTHVNKMHE